MKRRQFERLVAEALDSLPERFQERLDNVDVVVEQWPTREQLLRSGAGLRGSLYGLYEGVPLSRRTHGYGLVPPDRITIFQGPLERASREPARIRDSIRRVVVHEIAHHFGIDDGRLRELGV
jgi:predicted Zn-dependent protease with MMP-like domain